MGSIFSNEICCYKNKESEIEICSDLKKVKARQKSSILFDKCSKNKESSETLIQRTNERFYSSSSLQTNMIDNEKFSKTVGMILKDIDPLPKFFIKDYEELPHLCVKHMLKEKKFLTIKILEGISVYFKEINHHLFNIKKKNFFYIKKSNYIEEQEEKEEQEQQELIEEQQKHKKIETQEELEIEIEEKHYNVTIKIDEEIKLSLLNSNNKRYFRDSKFQSIFMIDNEISNNEYYIGIKILENKKLFAGKFDNEGRLQSNGLYINKKGNVFLGDFKDDDLSHGKIFQKNGLIYEGKLIKYKKYGDNEKEVNPEKYEFQGCFEKNKRKSGTVKIFNHPLIVQIKVKEYSENLLTNYFSEITFKQGNDEIIYKGNVKNKKLNDLNGEIIKSNGNNQLYKYIGEVKDNIKMGEGIYYWNEPNEYYKGEFFNNRLHTKTKFGEIKKDNDLFKITYHHGIVQEIIS